MPRIVSADGLPPPRWSEYHRPAVCAVVANVEHTSEWSTSNLCGKTKYYVSCVDKSQLGATFGGGIEAMLLPNVSFKAEYLRLELPTISTTGKDGYKQTWSDSANIIHEWLGSKLQNDVMEGKVKRDFQKFFIDA